MAVASFLVPQYGHRHDSLAYFTAEIRSDTGVALGQRALTGHLIPNLCKSTSSLPRYMLVKTFEGCAMRKVALSSDRLGNRLYAMGEETTVVSILKESMQKIQKVKSSGSYSHSQFYLLCLLRSYSSRLLVFLQAFCTTLKLQFFNSKSVTFQHAFLHRYYHCYRRLLCYCQRCCSSCKERPYHRHS